MSSSKIDLDSVPVRTGTSHPKRFHHHLGDVNRRRVQRVGEAAGLTEFGVNRVVLDPGASSSIRHWHTHEDEFIVVLEGEVVMITDEGETPMRAADMAGFKKGVRNAHCFKNTSSSPAVILAIGNRSPDDECYYPDIGMRLTSEREGRRYVNAEGVPYDDLP